MLFDALNLRSQSKKTLTVSDPLGCKKKTLLNTVFHQGTASQVSLYFLDSFFVIGSTRLYKK